MNATFAGGLALCTLVAISGCASDNSVSRQSGVGPDLRVAKALAETRTVFIRRDASSISRTDQRMLRREPAIASGPFPTLDESDALYEAGFTN